MAGQPIPLEIRTILDKSLILDPASRFASMQDMKQAIAAVAAKYSATTFNLAFYLSTLLKKEMEADEADRDKESKTNLAPYLTPAPVASVAAAVAAPPAATAAPARTKSRMPLIAAAVVLVIAGAAGVALAQLHQERKHRAHDDHRGTDADRRAGEDRSDVRPEREIAPQVVERSGHAFEEPRGKADEDSRSRQQERESPPSSSHAGGEIPK